MGILLENTFETRLSQSLILFIIPKSTSYHCITPILGRIPSTHRVHFIPIVCSHRTTPTRLVWPCGAAPMLLEAGLLGFGQVRCLDGLIGSAQNCTTNHVQCVSRHQLATLFLTRKRILGKHGHCLPRGPSTDPVQQSHARRWLHDVLQLRSCALTAIDSYPKSTPN